MATIYIDGERYEVDGKQNLLHVCLSLGFDLPYFCWHPAMGSVGACRQCAVKQFRNEQDTKGKIVMACMTPAAEGTRISIEDAEAAAFRKAVIEGLMLNHPHDCPVCDEGGECHLQDMTVMAGHDYRRTRFKKRTFRNQYLGPFVNHEMNRCIQCYRCVRFYREYAGGRDLHAFGLRNVVYFGRERDGVLESEFSGNLVEVCPTGVFTDATLKRHYTRKWDLLFAPSVCVHCGLGCNTSPGERYGMLRRIVNRYNGEVNGCFLCDRGRYGYEFVNSSRRIREPLIRWDGKLEPVTRKAALERVRALVSNNEKVIGIGSPRATLEANFALRKLVGPDRIFLGMADAELRLVSLMIEVLRSGAARSASLGDVELSDAVLVLGEDVPNTAPRMALALRQSVRRQPMQIAERLHIPLWLDHAVREAVQDARGPLFIATPNATRLDEIATETYRAAPDDIARLGFAVAKALDSGAPAVADLLDGPRSLAGRIAEALKNAKRPLIVSGASCGSEAIIHAAANVARALAAGNSPQPSVFSPQDSGLRTEDSGLRTEDSVGLSFIAPECNSFGLVLMGGGTLGEAFEAMRFQKADTAIVLENDLYRRATADAVNAFFDFARHIIVLDHLENPTTARAEVVLPAATFAEADGTLVSNEGRAQRFFRVFVPPGEIQESWRWLGPGAWQSLDDVIRALASEMPVFAGIAQAAPLSGFRMAEEKIPRAPHRYSGRTAMLANISVHEPKPPDDPDAPLTFTMEGYPAQPPSALIPFFWSPGWNSVQAINKFQSEVGGPLRGGDSGARIIEPPSGTGLQPVQGRTYFGDIPAAFESRTGQWLLVPVYYIFGSEELSLYSPPILERAAKAHVALNPDDAARLGLAAGEQAEVSWPGAAYRLPVEIAPDLPAGIAGLPAGVPPLVGVTLPAWSRITGVKS